ncbi:acyl-CoA dehydrogenase family protein, partial [Bacillus subtilis]|uniref:acyl-CoA dehydrogenase family protein n=1 Tax=Bacillus subtilis TaxID=1423 RepID=UPI000927002B
MEKIGRIAEEVQQTAAEDDVQGRFPAEKVQKLRDAGYTALTLPASHGGGGIAVYDMLLFQERLARGDAPTVLSIGWLLSVIGELGEGNSWDDGVFAFVAKEVQIGAVITRAVMKEKTAIPPIGGWPVSNHITKVGAGGWCGGKTFQKR